MKYREVNIKMKKGLLAFKHNHNGKIIKGEARTIKGITRKIDKALKQ